MCNSMKCKHVFLKRPGAAKKRNIKSLCAKLFRKPLALFQYSFDSEKLQLLTAAEGVAQNCLKSLGTTLVYCTCRLTRKKTKPTGSSSTFAADMQKGRV